MRIEYVKYKNINDLMKLRLNELTLDIHSWLKCLLAGDFDKERSDKVHVFLAKEGTSILGWATACYELRANPDTDSLVKCYLVNVFVDPKHRQKGIGSRLLEELKSQLAFMNISFVGFPFDLSSIILFEKHKIEDATFWDSVSCLEDEGATLYV